MHQFGTTQKPIFQGKHSELSDKIIKIFYEVHKELGYGFNEKVYLKALKIALQTVGLQKLLAYKWKTSTQSVFTFVDN